MTQKLTHAEALTDSFGRRHDYLRISLTDTCNFRCVYCMPEEAHFTPDAFCMQTDEILEIARQFVSWGIRKIRLTGGEPLARADFDTILSGLSQLPTELTLTTNGMLLKRYVDALLRAGVHSINISIDSLSPEKFQQITRRNAFYQVWENILDCLQRGMHIKLNCVLMKGVNDDEIIDFIALTRELPLHVRFIEYMPFDGNPWSSASVMPYAEWLERVRAVYPIEKLEDAPQDTAKKFRVPGYAGTFAIITTMSQPFCAGCNRLRLTADGHLKNCLFSSTELDLLGPLRGGENLELLVKQHIWEKKAATGGQLLPDFSQIDTTTLQNRSMLQIGG